MSNNLTLIDSKIDSKQAKTVELSDIDGLIKFVLATMLAVMPFFVQKMMSFGLLVVYLLIVTLLSKIKPRTLLISASSYFIVVLMPYLFGLLMNGIMYSFSNNELFAFHQGPGQIFLRLFRLFIIWYISILYFHTTPMKTVFGLLDKLLTPLKLVGIPVADFLKVVMCTVLELKETGTEIKKSLEESMRSALGGHRRKVRLNIKGLSRMIVSLIVNSFGKLDKIESFIERVNPEDLYNYNFRLSKREAVVVLSFILFTILVLMVEKGYWLQKILD